MTAKLAPAAGLAATAPGIFHSARMSREHTAGGTGRTDESHFRTLLRNRFLHYIPPCGSASLDRRVDIVLSVESRIWAPRPPGVETWYNVGTVEFLQYPNFAG